MADDNKTASMNTSPPSEKKMRRTSAKRADGAFDVWLNRGLHRLYDDVAKEPIPESLLRIIEADKGS